MAKLRVFSDPRYLPAGLAPNRMLSPFWGNHDGNENYEAYALRGGEFLELTGPAEAEVAALPFEGAPLVESGHPGHAAAVAAGREFFGLARAAGLRTAVVLNTDLVRPLDEPGTVVFRTSTDRHVRRPHEHAMPGWAFDLARRVGGRVPARDKQDVPTVGFCGHTAAGPPPWTRRVKTLARRAGRPFGLHVPNRDGVYLRQAAMEALERSPLVKTNFLRRSTYYGGAVADPVRHEQARREYVENSLGSDYVLCVRGYGNYSFRFFETMSLGRVPVLIDTDCVLPFDDLFDYREMCVIVPEHRLGGVAGAVAAFHARLSADEFRDLQGRIRRFWEEWLSPEGFFRNAGRYLRGSRPPAAAGAVAAGDGRGRL